MKIQLSSSAFTAACEQAVRVIPSKNPIPILSNLRFDVSDSVLHILGSTPDISFRSNVDVACDGSEVSFCLNPKFFLDAIKGLPEQLLTIEVDTDNFEISFSYNDGKGNFHVPGSSATEYPLRSELKEAHSFVINGEVLNFVLTTGLVAVSDDDLRPVLNGVYLDCKEDRLIVAASDSKKLIRIIRKDVTPGFVGSLIVPSAVAAFVSKIHLKKDADYTLSFDDKNFIIEGENINLNARSIEGRFPNYNVVIPKNNNIKVTLDRSAFESAVRRISCFANSATNQLAFSFEALGSLIEAQDIDMSSKGRETFNVEYPFPSMRIGFRAVFLIDALKVLSPFKEVNLCMSDPARAAYLEPTVPEDNSEVLVLIMPMMLSDF